MLNTLWTIIIHVSLNLKHENTFKVKELKFDPLLFLVHFQTLGTLYMQLRITSALNIPSREMEEFMNTANRGQHLVSHPSDVSDKCLTLLPIVHAHTICILIAASLNSSTVLLERIFECHCFANAGNTVCNVHLTGSFLVLPECLIVRMCYINYASKHREEQTILVGLPPGTPVFKQERCDETQMEQRHS